MQNELVVVDQAFQPKQCYQCHSRAKDWLGDHFCLECGLPQPVTSQDQDYFACFGMKRRFNLDRGLVEKRFFEVSRLMHPDRFAASTSEVRANSLVRMSLINEAYRCLKNQKSTRTYLLALERSAPRSADVRKTLPMELAESWFEIQDLLAEDREKAAHRVKQFEAELQAYQTKLDQEISEIEAHYDQAAEANDESKKGQLLEELSKILDSVNYLASLSGDVERIKSYAHSD